MIVATAELTDSRSVFRLSRIPVFDPRLGLAWGVGLSLILVPLCAAADKIIYLFVVLYLSLAWMPAFLRKVPVTAILEGTELRVVRGWRLRVIPLICMPQIFAEHTEDNVGSIANNILTHLHIKIAVRASGGTATQHSIRICSVPVTDVDAQTIYAWISQIDRAISDHSQRVGLQRRVGIGLDEIRRARGLARDVAL